MRSISATGTGSESGKRSVPLLARYGVTRGSAVDVGVNRF
jgi:hypothetical protein